MQTTLMLAIATTALIGPGAGMSLDQSIKQLPARHRIGVAAYSAYSRAGDQANGLFLYPPVGIGTLLFALAAAVSGHISGLPIPLQAPLDISGALAILHSLVTARAAPINFNQRRYELADEANLARVLDQFERWHSLRTALQVMNFGASLWATIALAGGL
jgi:hypothetical protein